MGRVSKKTSNPEEALTSAMSDKDDLQDILYLMDQVKSKRQRLKEIGQSHRDATRDAQLSVDRSSSKRTSRRGSSSNNSKTPSRRSVAAQLGPKKNTRRRTIQGIFQDVTTFANVDVGSDTNSMVQESGNNKIHRIFKDVMTSRERDFVNHNHNDDDEQMEEGEFVDEELNHDPAKDWSREQQNHRRIRIFRYLAAGIFIITLMMVLIFVVDRKEAEDEATVVQEHEPGGYPTTFFPKSDNDASGSSEEKNEFAEDEQDGTRAPSPTAVQGGVEASTHPTAASTPTPTQTVNCFATVDELDSAVFEYLKNPKPNSAMARKYGYPIGTWCVSGLENFDYVFAARHHDLPHLYGEFNEPLDGWDVSSATSMEGMFNEAKAFNQDLSSWNVSKVQNFRNMFRGCKSFDQNLSTWKLDNAEYFQSMFEGAAIFHGNGLEHWDMSHAKKVDRMFQGASLFNGTIGGWNVSNIDSMLDWFRDAISFDQDLHNWHFSPDLKRLSALFQGCSNFNGRVDGWNLGETSVDSLERVFYGASSFNQPLNSWDVSKIEKFDRMFAGARSFNHELSAWSTKFAYEFDEMFSGALSFDSDISTWDMTGAENLSQMFRGAKSFNQAIGIWKFSKATDMSYMFAEALSFNQDLSSWNTSTVETMTAIFHNAASFNGDITTWDVSRVKSMDLMFRDAVDFNQDLSGWDMVSVREMGGILVGAMSFNQDLCDWGPSLTIRLEAEVANSNTTSPDSALEVLFGSDHETLPPENQLFGASGCDDPSNPDYSEGSLVGPFCHSCDGTTP